MEVTKYSLLYGKGRLLEVVRIIKAQYARKLLQKDWSHFKKIAEYYLKTAASLKKNDIKSLKNKLLLRNSQKRLFLGIGCELLLKSYYLKNGYCINKFSSGFQGRKQPIHKLLELNAQYINENDTFTMNALIDNLHKIGSFRNLQKIKRGLKIAMTFRNKEAHITFPKHDFDHSNYEETAEAVELFFYEGFNQKLKFRISMEQNEKNIFRIST